MSPNRTPHAAWMDDFFVSYYAHRPVNATFIGVHDHDHRLPDFTEAGVGDARADTEDLLRLSEDPDGRLTTFEAIDRRLARGYLELQKWELGSAHFDRGNPSLYTGEAIFGVIGLFLSDFAPDAERIDAATARMSAIPDFLAGARANVRAAPSAWTERAIRECDGALAFFTEGVAELEAAFSPAAPTFGSAAAKAARAFADHRAFLESDLLTRDDPGYACGPDPFDLYLTHGHCLTRTAADVLAYAEHVLAEAEADLDRGVAELGTSAPDEALERLRDQHPTEDEYYGSFQRVWDEVRRASDEHELVTWPDFPIRYVPRPTWSRSAAPHLYFLFYRSPAAFDRPPVHDYLVAPLPDNARSAFLRANNDGVIKLNHVIHHGGLGHHVQNWHAYRAESRVGRVAAVDCAARVAMFCSGTMAEGWACYATDLAAEVGLLTSLERYAEVQGRVRMAARAIVDVRLHRGELTLDEAAAFYERRAGMSATASRGEAVKNSMFPGAALMYLIGTDAIHELRAAMTRRRGADFDLRAFHDTFLSYGSIPVSLIAEDMMKGTDHGE